MIQRTRKWRIVFFILVLCITGMLWGCSRGHTVLDADGTTVPAVQSPESSDTASVALPSEQDLEQYHTSIDQMRTLVADALDGREYFVWDQLPGVLNQMEQCAAELMESGAITTYERNDYCVYLEFASGIPCICAPPTLGTDGSTDIYAFSPFADEEMDDEGTLRGNTPTELNDLIRTTFPDLGEGLSYSNSKVNIDRLESLDQSQVFLWNGHGSYVDALGPVLVTGEAVQGDGLIEDTLDLLSKSKAMSENLLTERGSRYAITAKFVAQEIRMENGFVYLAACHSLQTEQLAQAFLDNGAEIVFGTTDAIMSGYDILMMEKIVTAMCGGLDDGIIHTAQEALEIAQSIFGVDDRRHRDKLNYGGTPAGIVYLGKYEDSGDYTFCSGIRGSVRAAIPTGQNNTVLLPDSTLVSLYNEDGDLAATTICDTSYQFYFDRLEPGTYSIEATYNQKPLTVTENIYVRDHRYTTVEIGLTPVSGSVVDELNNFLPGVTVEALHNGKVVATTETGDSGQYSLMLSDNNYTLRFVRAGYREGTKDITVKTDATQNAADAVLLDDMILQTGEIIFQRTAKYSQDQWTLYEGYHLVISPATDGASYTVGTSVWGDGLDKYREMIVSLELKPGAQTIADRAFCGCKALERISLPDTLSVIEDLAFENCIRLKSVIIPQSTTFLDDGAFKGCASLESVCFLGRVKSISTELFENCYSLKTVDAGGHIVYIGERAFSGCMQLESISLSQNFQYFSTDALKNCIGLKEIIYGGSEHTWQTVGLANNQDFLSGVTITFERLNDHFNLDNPDYSQLNPIRYGSCGRTVDWVLYENYLMELTGSGTAFSKDDRFDGFADQIRWLVIGQGIETLDRKIFERAHNLLEVRISDSVTKIGESAFSICSSLETVWLPANLEVIGTSAFSNCDSLTDVYYPGTEEQWNAIEISFGNDSLDQATIHFNS